MSGNILIMFAEFERERSAERRRESKVHLDNQGKWNGGTVRFGYKPTPAPDGGYYLEPEPSAVKIINKIADDILAGKSASSIAKDLIARNIPTAQGGEWRQSTVTRILRSPHIKGLVIGSDNKVIRNPDGTPLRRTAIITDEKWAEVQAALDQNTKVIPSGSNDAPMLLQVAFCPCGKPMYLMRKASRPHANYYCSTKTSTAPCDNRMWIRSDLLEGYVREKLLDAAGDVPMRVRVTTPAVDNSAEVADVEDAIANLMELAEAGMFRGDRSSQFNERMTALEARKAALEAETTGDEPTWTETDETFGNYFTSLTSSQQRQFMLSASIKVYVELADTSPVMMELSDGTLMEVDPMLPEPDPTGRVITGMLSGKYKVTIHLGDVATLRDLAAQS